MELYFEREIVYEFYCLRATLESFLHKILGMPHPPIDRIGFTLHESFLHEMLTSHQST